MKGEKIDRTEMPVVQSSFKKYESTRRMRTGLFWASFNLAVAVFTISEIQYGSIFHDLHIKCPVVWYAELVIALWCSLRVLTEVIFCFAWLIENPVILTSKQYQLLGIHPKDKRFTPLQKKSSQDIQQNSATLSTTGVSPVIPISSPSRVSPPGSQGSFPLMAISSSSSAYIMPGSAPGSRYSPTYSFQDVPTSQLYQASSYGNMSLRNRLFGGSDSPYSPTKFSPVHYNDITLSPDTSYTGAARYPSPSSSPYGYSITSGSSNVVYTPLSHGSYHWTPYNSYTEYSTPLNVYKLGTRGPLASTSKDEDEFGHMSPQAEELWLKFGTSRQDLDLWTENLRKWISQTVLCKLVKQIDEINSSLQRIGSSELQIGAISVGSLRQVSITKAEHVPTLAAVLPYLELSNNQEYLVKRMKELGKDSCMGAYRWKFGSDYRGRRWDQDLPTDAQIVMHVFCTYMDSRLPTDPRFPDGRTFTGLYFLKNLDKPDCKRRDLAILRFKQNPPHFKVMVGDDVYDVGKGRNNLFHSIILFLLMVKTKQLGMLGRVNLGPSGVNILGIFTKRC